ncbi:hypothetical protein [Streptococcus pneumoniae]|uniref:hypothetical protein n=1 Tax=Streptococcus pneumoniae TaxID=1313 RepID=UPI000B5915FC|nr:hypothetical protein [Streptococcus pneumoniae]
MKIKEQTRKLAAGCSKQYFEVVDEDSKCRWKHCFEVVDRTDRVSITRKLAARLLKALLRL